MEDGHFPLRLSVSLALAFFYLVPLRRSLFLYLFLRFLLPFSLFHSLFGTTPFNISVFLSPASFNIPRFILVASSIRLLLFLSPFSVFDPLLPSPSLSLTARRESEKRGQNLAIYLSLFVSPAALWASLDIRENVRTGVRGNPTATQGVDRDDDDDDKLPAGKALRSTAGVEKAWKRRKGG